jgi:hypothetical protein
VVEELQRATLESGLSELAGVNKDATQGYRIPTLSTIRVLEPLNCRKCKLELKHCRKCQNYLAADE